MNLPRLLRQQAQSLGDRPFVRCDGVDLSYGEADDQASRGAAALTACGVRRGDTVVVMMGNSLEYLHAWFGLSKLGAVMVPVNPALRGEGLTYVLRHSDARLAIVDAEVKDVVASARADTALERVISTATWAELLRSAPADDAGFEPDDADVCSIIYTSGTTGPPKGVMLPHHSYVNTGRYFAEDVLGLVADDRLFTLLPLFHVNAQQLSTMGSLASGTPLSLGRQFSARGFWDELRREEATVFNYIGAMIAILWKQPPGAGDADHHVRTAVGAAAPAEIWRAFEDRFGLTLLEGYGLTETGTLATVNPPRAIRTGSIGAPVRWCDVKVVDEGDQPLPAGDAGEIIVRFTEPNTGMLGYYREPEATETAMRGGWFHTGDRGRTDDDGYVYFLDRIKDCIRRRGENISSFELERVLAQHAGVLEVAIIGVPSELGEDDVMACVVARTDAAFEPEEFHAWAAGQLASFQVPRYVRVVAEMPKTETQRTQKYVLRQSAFDSPVWDSQAAVGARS